MARVALVAFFVGAAMAGALFKFLEGRHAGRSVGTPLPLTDASLNGSSDTEAEVLRLRAALADANAAVEGLRMEVETRKSGSAPSPKTPDGHAMSWKSLRSRILEARKDQTRFWDMNDSGSQDLLFEFQSLMREAARLQGIDPDELTMAPDGLPALAAEFLESFDPPLDDAALARVRETLEELGSEWDEYLRSRGSLTKLEEDRELARMWDKLDARMTGVIPEEQADAWSDLTGFWSTAAPSSFYGGYVTREFNSMDEAAREFSETWGEDLGLDAEQRFSLRPLVKEYAMELELLRVEEARRGIESTSTEARREIMIRIQQKIASSLTLSAKQAEALRHWTRIEGIEIR